MFDPNGMPMLKTTTTRSREPQGTFCTYAKLPTRGLILAIFASAHLLHAWLVQDPQIHPSVSYLVGAIPWDLQIRIKRKKLV